MEDGKEKSLQHDVFLKFFSAERHRIFRFIYSLIPLEADAEDVFQQTSVTLWKKFEDFDQNREFYPWACAIAHNTVLNFRRSAKRKRLFLNDELVQLLAETQTRTQHQRRYRQDLLEECIAQLRQNDQRLLTDIYHKNRSAAEVAKQRGKAIQTIYNRLNIIRKRLLDCINNKSQSYAN